MGASSCEVYSPGTDGKLYPSSLLRGNKSRSEGVHTLTRWRAVANNYFIISLSIRLEILYIFVIVNKSYERTPKPTAHYSIFPIISNFPVLSVALSFKLIGSYWGRQSSKTGHKYILYTLKSLNNFLKWKFLANVTQNRTKYCIFGEYCQLRINTYLGLYLQQLDSVFGIN